MSSLDREWAGSAHGGLEPTDKSGKLPQLPGVRVRVLDGVRDGMVIVLALKIDGAPDMVAIVEKIQAIITHAAPPATALT